MSAPDPAKPDPPSPDLAAAAVPARARIRSAWRRLTAAQRPDGLCQICARWQGGGLCGECCARFAPARPRCARCALALGTAAEACGECLGDPPPWRRAHAAVDYGFPWDGLIGAFKFQGRAELAAPLAALLLPPLREAQAAAGAQAIELVVPMPLTAARLAERGFNQAWELARPLARALQLPATPALLQRVIETPHQAALTRAERLHNLRGAFAVLPGQGPPLAGRRVALVDDVMTTGATAREASAALLRAGAAAVDLWLLARTPTPTSTPTPSQEH